MITNRFVKGTTPTFTLTAKNDNLDLTSAENVYVTLEQGSVKYTKTGANIDVDKNVVKVWLSQTESLALKVGKLDAQINWTYFDGNGNLQRDATEVGSIIITSQLLNEVIS